MLSRRCARDDAERADVIDVLGALVDKSLVELVVDDEDTTRYRLLETIRDYGCYRLDERGRNVVSAVGAAHRATSSRWSSAPHQNCYPKISWPGGGVSLPRTTISAPRTAWALSSGATEIAVRFVAALRMYWSHRVSHAVLAIVEAVLERPGPATASRAGRVGLPRVSVRGARLPQRRGRRVRAVARGSTRGR